MAPTFDEPSGSGCVSIVNRSTTDTADMVVCIGVCIADRPITATAAPVLRGAPKAANGWDAPDRVGFAVA